MLHTVNYGEFHIAIKKFASTNFSTRLPVFLRLLAYIKHNSSGYIF